MKKITVLLFAGISCLCVNAQIPTQFITSANWVQAKNYYLLTLFEKDKPVNDVLKNDPEFKKLNQKKLADLSSSLAECKDGACLTSRLKFTDDEIKLVSAELTALCKPGSALDILVKTQLRPSYTYSLYQNATDAELLAKAWEQDATGINYAIGVYGDGKKPNYPLIDSISFNTGLKMYKTLLYDVNTALIGDLKYNKLFFEPGMQAALLFLQINERQDPANYEPMGLTVNKAAIDHIKNLKWGQYPYSVILIPGAGPDNLTTPLSAEGMLRCRMAAVRYRAGDAPFIMPSGGKAHPFKTKYCEAEEMKKYLVNVLHIPAYAVIMEPHARHTTTNFRNGVRLMYRYGLPAAKPALSVTDKSQTDYIVTMASRCELELKYVPYRLGKRLSETAVEFYPLPEAMQINPLEPLDP